MRYNYFMNYYSFKATKDQLDKIFSFFGSRRFERGTEPLTWKFRNDDVSINIYNTGSVVFSGKQAEKYYRLFFKPGVQTLPQAGSDEVGTGDFFGPICVCASYVDEHIFDKISSMNLTDSKQLTDLYIREIAPELIEAVPHSLLILDNSKYNVVIKNNNMNVIKARMHNKAYINLQKKGISLPELCVVDDFCGEALYYRYIGNENETFNHLTFQTKAESKYVSVAIGSIISRYAFLKYMDELGEKYLQVFPKGAGQPVDEFAKDFVREHGLEELKKVAKCNFKNYQKLL